MNRHVTSICTATSVAMALAWPAHARPTPCDLGGCGAMAHSTPCWKLLSTSCNVLLGTPIFTQGPPVLTLPGPRATCDGCGGAGGTLTLTETQERGVSVCVNLGVGVKIGASGNVCGIGINGEGNASSQTTWCLNTKRTSQVQAQCSCEADTRKHCNLAQLVVPITVTISASYFRTACHQWRSGAGCDGYFGPPVITTTAFCGKVLHTATDTEKHVVAGFSLEQCPEPDRRPRPASDSL